VITWLTLYFT